ncbi:MAG TPA: GIY-YIG nuclease family protein [Methanocorpusculum sp.]|nr:GIY-YIG nuclease family protein [Methanocorpusculum sp.]
MLTTCSYDLVKIGYATDVEERVKKLNKSECLPYPYYVYATYETTSTSLLDITLHGLIDKLNPELRTKCEYEGKERKREFYKMAPIDAYTILESIAIISNTEKRLKRWYQSDSENHAIEEEKAEKNQQKSRFTFSSAKIPIGSEIYFINKPNIPFVSETDLNNKYPKIVARVVGDTEIEYNGKTWSLSRLAKELANTPYGLAGPRYWYYKGKSLCNIRDECEHSNTN